MSEYAYNKKGHTRVQATEDGLVRITVEPDILEMDMHPDTAAELASNLCQAIAEARKPATAPLMCEADERSE